MDPLNSNGPPIATGNQLKTEQSNDALRTSATEAQQISDGIELPLAETSIVREGSTKQPSPAMKNYEGREIQDSGSESQDDLPSTQPKFERLPVSSLLHGERVKNNADVLSDAEAGGALVLTSDIPELDLEQSNSVRSGTNSGDISDVHFYTASKTEGTGEQSCSPSDESSSSINDVQDNGENSDDANTLDLECSTHFESEEDPIEQPVHAEYHDGEDEDEPEYEELPEHQNDIEYDSDSDPNAIYEAIGIDRKYFDHDYYLLSHGPADRNTHQDDAKPVEMADTPEVEDGETSHDKEIPMTPKEKRKRGFHEHEHGWVLLFFEKIKAVINNSWEIQIPSDTLTYKLFNSFFEGKVLKDADGQPLPPCTPRKFGSLHNHLRRPKNVKLVTLREEILNLLQDSNDCQLYVPIITQDEIEQYCADGAVVVDDPSDPAKNGAFALPEKEIKLNETTRMNANRKRKRVVDEVVFPSPKQASDSEQVDRSGNALSPRVEPNVQEDQPRKVTWAPTNLIIEASNTTYDARESGIDVPNRMESDTVSEDDQLDTNQSDVDELPEPIETTYEIEPDPFWKAHMQAHMQGKK